MTLDKHKLDGVAQIQSKTLPVEDFEGLLRAAGYLQVGTAPAQGRRLKVWWSHGQFRRVEAIYSPDGKVAITAYHVED
ncbi:MAG: hypothetical protein ACO4AI_05655 [Prochlorothrix sp.]|nr:hypothetical protein [Prochlorothrix sp.]